MARTKAKKSVPVNVKRQIKAPSHAHAKRVEKGKMSIDTEQMIKDLVELGRIKETKKESKKYFKETSERKKPVNAFVDLSNSPLLNLIQRENHGSYMKVAVTFLVIVALFFASILYVVNSRAVINVVLKKSETNTQIQRTFNVYDVAELNKANNSAIVVSVSSNVSVNDSFPITSSQIVRLDKAEGKIKIINNTSTAQGLVATTRFVSASTGDLYRLKDSVNVPANSSIDAEVYSDQASANGEISGTKFSIPGLKSDEIRKLIYGESISPITHDGYAKAVVTEEDITKAKNMLEVKLRQASVSALQDKISVYNDFALVPDSLTFNVSSSSVDGVKAGDEVDGINISGIAQVSALYVSKTKLLDVVKSNILSQNVSSNIVKIKENTLSYSLSKMDLVNKLASLIVSVSNYISYDVDKILNREDISGMNINDFYIYAQDKSFADRIQVISYPFWSKSLPKIPDNISIKVK